MPPTAVTDPGPARGVDDLTLALNLADLADTLTLPAFRSADLHVETKPDLTPVTDADRGTERALRGRIASERPADAVIGEEDGVSGSGSRRWILDPIDGTKNFVRGIPVWGTLIALEVDGALTTGVVSAPALGRRWWAGRELGAFAGPCSGPGAPQPIRVSSVASLADAQLSAAGLSGSWARHGGAERYVALAQAAWRDRGFGDFWSHMLVAEGACDVGVDPEVSLWDLAALQVVVEEAGGRFSDFAGVARPDGGSAVSSNGLLHDEALAILAGHG